MIFDEGNASDKVDVGKLVLQAFNGLRSAPSVQQVKPQALVHGRRRNSVQPVKALLNPADDPILKEALKV
jgi:hypothetical protein